MTQSISADLRSFNNWPANTKQPAGSTSAQEASQVERSSTHSTPQNSGAQAAISTPSDVISGQEMNDLFKELLALSEGQADSDIDQTSVDAAQTALQNGTYAVDLDRLAQQLLKAADL